MNNREWMILDALNIASTIHRDALGYGATAEQISDVLATDERIASDYTPGMRDINPRSMANYLGHLAGVRKGSTDRTPDGRYSPLVERVAPGSGRFRMTPWALKVVTA